MLKDTTNTLFQCFARRQISHSTTFTLGSMNIPAAIKRAFVALIFSGALFAVTATGLFFSVSSWYRTPTSPLGQWKLIEIPAGTPLSTISKLLKDQRLINNPLLFKLVGKYWLKNSLKAGEYKLNASMTPQNIFSVLIQGKEHLHPITIPEGLNIYETAALFEKHKFAGKSYFIKLCFDKFFISQFNFIKGESLEGYLFPSTYFFRKGESVENMIKKMVSTFKEVALPEIVKKSSGLTQLEIVVLASLIEKETSLEEEKRTISSVFTNRLKKQMRLQCDPTVIYAIKNFDGNIRRKDLLIDSPYNTYRYKGLPPGPIANPGKTSILAALYPSGTNYLYFVATKKGGHFFSKTLKSHNRAVRKFQLNRG